MDNTYSIYYPRFGNRFSNGQDPSGDTSPKAFRWDFTFRDAADGQDTAVIDINGVIGRDILQELITGEASPNTVESITSRLRDITASTIIVNINSPGGDANDGLSIHDALAQHDARIDVRINGMTASSATVIAQAGDSVSMSDNALLLVHNAMIGICGWFNRDELSMFNGDLQQLDQVIANIYAKRSGRDVAEFQQLMAENAGRGIWLTAQEAMDKGLVDSVFEPSNVSGSSSSHTQNRANMLKDMGLPAPEDKASVKEGPVIANITVDATDIIKSALSITDDSQDSANKKGPSTTGPKDSIESKTQEPTASALKDARSREIEILRLKG